MYAITSRDHSPYLKERKFTYDSSNQHMTTYIIHQRRIKAYVRQISVFILSYIRHAFIEHNYIFLQTRVSLFLYVPFVRHFVSKRFSQLNKEEGNMPATYIPKFT